MDESLAKALKKKKELEAQLTQINQYITLHQTLFGEVDESGKRKKPVQDQEEHAGPEAVADAAAEVIRKAGRPLTRGEILKGLLAAGVKIRAADQSKYVGTILWRRSDRFVNIEGEGYWLKGQDLPPRKPVSPDLSLDDLLGP